MLRTYWSSLWSFFSFFLGTFSPDHTNLKGILPRMMQICVIFYTHLAYTRMSEMLYIRHSELFNELK